MSCTELGPLLSGWIDDALDEAERARVAAHLEGCAPCREELDELQALSELAGAAVPLPDAAAWDTFDLGLQDGLRGASAPAGEVISFRSLSGQLAAAAALVLAFLAVWQATEPRLVIKALGRLTFASLEHDEPGWEPGGRGERPVVHALDVVQGSEALEQLQPQAVAVLTSHGVVQVTSHAQRLSEIYPLEQDAGGPAQLATADASLLISGAVASRVALTIERELIVPETRRVLRALSVELRVLEARARHDSLRAAARRARERVGVAMRLEGIELDLPRGSLERVDEEVARIRHAEGEAASPLDGVVFDYRRCRPRGLFVSQGDHARAMAWLSQRGLRLSPDHPEELLQACLIAAALSQAILPDGRTALAAQAKLEAALEVLYGTPDGLTPLDVLFALRQGLEQPRPPLALLVERPRLAAVARQAQAVSSRRRGRIRGRDDDGVPRAYLLGHLRSLEGMVFTALTGPGRSQPSSLDLLVALGSRRARTAVSAAGLDGPRYDLVLETLRPRVQAWHDASLPVPLEASLEQARLWAVAPVVAPRARSPLPFQASSAYRDRLLLASLAALSAPQPAADVFLPAAEVGALPIVEPLPRLHARLAFTAKRLRRLLEALLDPSPARDRALGMVDRVARLEEALRDASLDALAQRRPSDATTRVLQTYADTLRQLGPNHPFAAEDVYDLGARALHRATYRLDRLYVTVRDPWTWRPRLAIGAALAACELVSDYRLTPLEVAGHPQVAIPSWASHHEETHAEGQ